MRVWLLALGLLAIAALVSGQEKKKPAEFALLEFHVRRDVDLIHLDGRVKNIGGQRAEGVTMIIHFLAPGGVTLETKRGPLETEDVEPGQEAVFMFETPFPARSVKVKLEAEGRGEREIKMQKSGPHAIE